MFTTDEKYEKFRKALEHLINYHSMENGSDTPDFILAEYLVDCLQTYDKIAQIRAQWYGPEPTTRPAIRSLSDPE